MLVASAKLGLGRPKKSSRQHREGSPTRPHEGCRACVACVHGLVQVRTENLPVPVAPSLMEANGASAQVASNGCPGVPGIERFFKERVATRFVGPAPAKRTWQVWEGAGGSCGGEFEVSESCDVPKELPCYCRYSSRFCQACFGESSIILHSSFAWSFSCSFGCSLFSSSDSGPLG